MVAVVVRYADNILKGFAAGVSIICSVICEVFLFHVQPSVAFVAGAALVNVSVYLYGKPLKAKEHATDNNNSAVYSGVLNKNSDKNSNTNSNNSCSNSSSRNEE